MWLIVERLNVESSRLHHQWILSKYKTSQKLKLAKGREELAVSPGIDTFNLALNNYKIVFGS